MGMETPPSPRGGIPLRLSGPSQMVSQWPVRPRTSDGWSMEFFPIGPPLAAENIFFQERSQTLPVFIDDR
jgi:hypothetical protein